MRGFFRSLFCLPRGRWHTLVGVEDDRSDPLKCDEKRPSCKNCTNHDVECSFTSNGPSTEISSTETPEAVTEARPRAQRFQPYHYSTGELKQTFRIPKPKNKPKQSTVSKATQCDLAPDGPIRIVSLADLQLFHNYTISTFRTMREEDQDLHELWQKHIPEWGIEFPSILHLILALSSLHLAYKKPELRGQYIEQADSHFTFGVRSVTAVLSQLNADNCQKIYIAATLICFIYFGRGPRPGEYLIFSDSGPAEWLVLMNGVKFILQSHHAKIFSGILEPPPDHTIYSITPAMRSERHEHTVHLQAVQRLVEGGSVDEREMCISAIQDLFEIMDDLYDRVSVGKQGGSLMHLLIGWLYRRPEAFVHTLEQKQPHALVILAYWAVLLKYMESAWFMEGWSDHVLTGISSSLHPDYLPWIDWPLRKAQQAG
ncbi:hypothetical protein N7520_010973 [Penicillium odoratum]|uniref:uncharacterized protein n=1 Tax=Penicillium odoratum TaxID=1167516 RepID=UPI0025469839|nr:uncharacterized protein N7520_010973 [Penicillium odoratum]KAJ5745791.1 hypothetical protein N7520_010973 [Penicillium odoratum]